MLVLGSLPGERSLAAGQYYAHPQNRFWRLAGEVIGGELEALAYEDRLAALLAARIGLWDCIASARRRGSLDSAIREAESNPLAALCQSLPALRAVGMNGATATKIGTKTLAGSGLTLVPLPSSSPAYAAMPMAEKSRRWADLRQYLR